MPQPLDAIEKHVTHLKEKHHDIHDELDHINVYADEGYVTRLKKEKLKVKDELSYTVSRLRKLIQ